MTAPRLLSNRYELGEMLWHGSLSEVYRGRDVRLAQDVAVKVLRADRVKDSELQDLFRRKAQSVASLDHPAIVKLHDTGETRTDDGQLPYIVMEYVDGRTLYDMIKTEGPLTEQRAVEIMADVSAALGFSHLQGIVHGGLKPPNVMITRTGAVKVMNFGVARGYRPRAGVVMATAEYMSPEQARGEAMDARSDVYAAGCMLFLLLTGTHPFTGGSPVVIALQHIRDEPRTPSEVRPGISRQLELVVLKALAKNAANRYQNGTELQWALVNFGSGSIPPALALPNATFPVNRPVSWAPIAPPFQAPAPSVTVLRNPNVLRVDTARQREEPHGQNVYTFDNSKSLSTSTETIRVAHTAKVEVSVQLSEAKAIGGNAGVKIASLASAQGRIQREILAKHSLDIKQELVFEQTTSINIPASTKVQVVFQWIRIWAEGIVTLGQRGVPMAEVPYSVTIGLRFNKKTSDIV